MSTLKRKKRGGLSQQMGEAFHALSQQNGRTGEGKETNIDVEKVSFDETNARKNNKLTVGDVIAIRENGDDWLFQRFQSGEFNKEQVDFFERLQGLANAIERDGLDDAITVFESGERYQLLGGERRTLAHFLLGRTSIRATIKPRPSHELDRQTRGFLNNYLHDGLSLIEKIEKVIEIAELYDQTHGDQQKLSPAELTQLLGMTKRTAQRYHRIITAPIEVLNAIRAGKITTWNEIETILKPGNIDIVLTRLADVIAEKNERVSDADIALSTTAAVVPLDTTATPSTTPRPVKRGAKKQGVNLGLLKDLSLVRKMLRSVMTKTEYAKRFRGVDINSATDVEKVWKQYVKDKEL